MSYVTVSSNKSRKNIFFFEWYQVLGFASIFFISIIFIAGWSNINVLPCNHLGGPRSSGPISFLPILSEMLQWWLFNWMNCPSTHWALRLWKRQPFLKCPKSNEKLYVTFFFISINEAIQLAFCLHYHKKYFFCNCEPSYLSETISSDFLKHKNSLSWKTILGMFSDRKSISLQTKYCFFLSLTQARWFIKYIPYSE